MKKTVLLLALMATVTFAGAAFGNSLSVTSTAAMGGVAQNDCEGDGQPGPCGLAVFHDNTSAAFVEDRTPENEGIYRASFLLNPNNVSQLDGNFRQVIINAVSPNPTPGHENCGNAAFANAFRVFARFEGGNGQIYRLMMEGNGNLCGKRATGKITIPADQPARVCLEWEAGNASSGRMAMAVVGPTDACPASGDAAYVSRGLSNGRLGIDRIRMGTPSTNGFTGVDQNGTMFFDEFESFRTLAP